MRLLLDTHVWIWWLVGDRRLPASLQERIGDPATVVHVSAASVWEMSIKEALGRLDLGEVDLAAEIAADDFLELPIRAAHALRAGRLPDRHDDPFDRMLVAQAKAEGLTLVTADRILRDYEVDVVAID